MKRCSISFAIRKLEIKATIRCDYVFVERLKFKTLTILNAGINEKLKELSFLASKKAKRYSHFGSLFASCLQS